MTNPTFRVGHRPSEGKQQDSTKNADDWVGGGRGSDPDVDDRGSGDKPQSEPTGKTKRLTLDLPIALHTSIKTSCAQRNTKMVEEIREMLWERYGNTETR